MNQFFSYSNYSTWHDPARINNHKGTVVALATICAIHFAYIMGMILIYKILLQSMKVSDMFLIFVDGINLILLITIFILGVCLNNFTSEVVDPYKAFLYLGCGDVYTNSVFSMAFGGLIRVLKFFLPIAIITMMEICIIILYYIYYFWRIRGTKDHKHN